MLTSMRNRCKASFLRGQFQFEKIFRTSPGRLGGLGTLFLKDKTIRNIYIHTQMHSTFPEIDTRHRYSFSGYVKPLTSPFKNEQNFSFYLWSRNIRYHSSSFRLKRIKHHSISFLQKCRQSLFAALTLSNERFSHVYRAILMGKKENLSKEQLQHFFYTGTMHLFAVSGLHVGVVSTFIFFFCKLLFLPNSLRLTVTGIFVCFYSIIVGLSPSTLRAMMMVLFVLVARAFSRPIDVKGAFFNTIAITLAINPFELWDVGFQLSYGTVACILCVGVPLATALKRKYNTVRAFKESCIVSCCASMISCVFSVYYWGIFSPWIFLANLFLIPLASVVVVLGIISWMIYVCLPILLPVFENLSHFCIFLLVRSVEIIEKFPGTLCNISMPPYLFYLSLFLFLILMKFVDRFSCDKNC